jgi:hypothetical protein
MSTQMSISVLVIAISVTVLLAVTSKVIFSQDSSINDTQEKSAANNETIMMLGGSMTFGSSLDNARMHLIEAIMDLNQGDIKGAIMQLNMTDQGIKMHQKEMMDMKNSMKNSIKPNMSATASNKTQNESS